MARAGIIRKMPPAPRWSRNVTQRMRPTSGTSQIHSVPAWLRSVSRLRSGMMSSIIASTSASVSTGSPSIALISPSTRMDGRDCDVRYSVDAPRAAAILSRRSMPAGCSGVKRWACSFRTLRDSGSTTDRCRRPGWFRRLACTGPPSRGGPARGRLFAGGPPFFAGGVGEF